MARSLGINENYVTTEAKRTYKLASEKYFTQGRKRKHVIAVCLYIGCRYTKYPLLLIDFAMTLKEKLYDLANCYLKLLSLLHLNEQTVPQVDPSIFLHKYCKKLEFGEKTGEVSRTALKIIQCMNRDWITTGRRPTGLCGAAILIAARYHGFKRSIPQIVKSVHACDETIRKRIIEFSQTEVARLTREEFENDGDKKITIEADPPSFIRNRLKEGDLKRLKNIEGELNENAGQIEYKVQHQEGSEDKLQVENSQKEPQNSKSPLASPKLTQLTPSEGLSTQPTIANTHAQKAISGIEEALEDCEKASNSEETSKMALKPVDDADLKGKKLKDGEDDNLSEISEGEVSPFILTVEESKLKTIIWNESNKDWLEAQSLKQAENANKDDSKTKVVKKRRKMDGEAASAAEALINSSKLNNKINKNQLRNLFEPKRQKLEEENEKRKQTKEMLGNDSLLCQQLDF
eukprot:CAMPEP_0115041098 /NCGR_PEP_ID=MMETSP0216-20121206/45306_1 /TAXON_ID=223996 /ORGANISM="Protocruzia adherens, Strain Boccale" /LENGTH=460 /DNA_ID=CAMNT_0002422633 /DNA_START=455 /DNA_END=1837 /DNA_ORIENTATION=-